MKACSKCGLEKTLRHFNSSKRSKDGHLSCCKLCIAKHGKLYRQKNKKEVKERKRVYYQENKEEEERKRKERHLKNPEKRREQSKKYTLKNREKHNETSREYQKKNRSKIRVRRRVYEKKRYSEDLFHRLKCIQRSRVGLLLKSKKWSKGDSFSLYIGCDAQTLIDYIGAKFTSNMCWDNHKRTGWHIDHIVPLSSAKTVEELYKLCHYTNLQPLWAEENLKKTNNMDWNK